MNLLECFEKFDPETWASNLNLNRMLFWPPDVDRDPASSARNWLNRLIAVNAGEISLRSVCEEYIRSGNLLEAFEGLHYLNAAERVQVEEQIRHALVNDCTQASKLLQDLNGKIRRLRASDLPESIESELKLAERKLKGLELRSFSDLISAQSISESLKHSQDVHDLEDEIDFIGLELSDYQKELFDKTVKCFESITKTITPFLQEEDPDKSIKDCFLWLPKLVLNRQLGELKRIKEALASGEIERLKELKIEAQSYSTHDLFHASELSPISAELSKMAEWPNHLPLKPLTSEILKKEDRLNQTFDTVEDVRSLVDAKVRRTDSHEKAAKWLLQGANTIIAMGRNDVVDLRARGLMEWAEHFLHQRKYSNAFDVFLDTLRLWSIINPDTSVVRPEHRRTITGAILSAWLPRVIARRPNALIDDLLSSGFENPAAMLNEIVDLNEHDIIFHCYDPLGESNALRTFYTFLEENCPSADWRSILVERVLQPRLIYQSPSKTVLQLRMLFAPFETDQVVHEVLEKVSLLIEGIAAREEASFRRDVVTLEDLCNRLRSSLQDSKANNVIVLHTLLDASSIVLSSMKAKIEPANEIQFTARPVNTIFFIEEKSTELEFIVSLSVAQSSLPIHSFVIEARVDRKIASRLNNLVSLPLSKIGLGSLDPGTDMEVVLKMNVDPAILTEYSEAAIELIFFEGSREVKPLDKKRIFNISFRTERRGYKGNPFVAGPAIEKDSLFVGRDQELTKIKEILVGLNQDNIPLLLGMRRIGKTSILKRLISDKDINRLYIPILYDLQDMPESETASQFLRKLCTRIHEECGEKWKIPFVRNAFEEDPFDAFDKYLMSFSTAPGQIRILIIFDEFEKFVSNLTKWKDIQKKTDHPPDPRSSLVPEVLGALRKAMLHANRISFIISGLPAIKSSFQEYESRWFGLMTPMIIKPLDVDEAKKLIQPPGIPYTVSPEAMDEIIYMTGCQPYLIQLVCKNLFTYITETGRETVARHDVEKVVRQEILPNESYFSDYFRLIGEDDGILRAMALTHRKLGRGRRYIPLDSVLDLLNIGGGHYTRDGLSAKIAEMERAERPLLERNPTRSDSHRIVIGMISRLLEDAV
jgi:hypothetical protein